MLARMTQAAAMSRSAWSEATALTLMSLKVFACLIRERAPRSGRMGNSATKGYKNLM